MNRGRNLVIGAIGAPLVLAGTPAIVFFALMLLFGGTPATSVVLLFLGFVFTVLGLLAGGVASGVFLYRRSTWVRSMREMLAADGIQGRELDWFRNELKPSERRSLKQLTSGDPLLADSYRDMLAARLTATRMIRSSRRELQLMNQRRNKLKRINSKNSQDFQVTLTEDIARIESINDEAKVMLAEAETRLQMIEAAAVRGSDIADSELILKRLSARTRELPLALEQARLTDEIRAELERELDEISD